jgi:hypothetical protein
MLPEGGEVSGVVRRIAEALPAAGRAADDTRCCDVCSCGLSTQYDIGSKRRLREIRADFFSAPLARVALGNL